MLFMALGHPLTAGGVVLYGGHFSPPHVTHLAEALAARAEVGASKVILIPSAPRAQQHEHRRTEPGWLEVPPHRRYAMTWLATRGRPGLEASPVEVGRTEVGYSSSRTVLELAARVEQPVWLLMGSDVLARLPDWERVDEVLERVDLLVTEYPPRLLTLPPRLAARYRQVSPGTYVSPTGRRLLLRRFDTGGISSGQVRHAVAEGRPIDALVPPWVARYIAHYRLYEPGGGTP
jgi:nicotinate-nucleotide adenylyltransferase